MHRGLVRRRAARLRDRAVSILCQSELSVIDQAKMGNPQILFGEVSEAKRRGLDV